jgi:hypothetical protein
VAASSHPASPQPTPPSQSSSSKAAPPTKTTRKSSTPLSSSPTSSPAPKQLVRMSRKKLRMLLGGRSRLRRGVFGWWGECEFQ